MSNKTYFSPVTQQTVVVNNRLLMVSNNVGLEYNNDGGIPLESV